MNATNNARVALITGASRGIGRAILDRLADDGFFVIGTATSEEGADGIRRHLEARGNAGLAYAVRVDDRDAVEGLVERIRQDADSPLVLVNNAGVTRDNLLLRMQDAEWQEVIRTNVSSIFYLCKPLLRAMTRARWGRIINVSSVVGRMGNAGQTNYAASKAAIEGFTRALALEVGSRSITVNAVAPGFIETDMTRSLGDDVTQAMLSRVPLGRMGTVEDVAHTVAFLASDGAAYITGETIQVNGGLYMS
jgi:3-oxoacyl-[acyl-carrier protein] reductase